MHYQSFASNNTDSFLIACLFQRLLIVLRVVSEVKKQLLMCNGQNP